jgi:hypothetical protein
MNRVRLTEKIRSSKGATAVEFALILPVLLLILFGIIEFGLLLYNKAVITNASREGARAGIVYAYREDPGNPGTPDLRISSDDIRGFISVYTANHLVNFCPDDEDVAVTIEPENPVKLPSGDYLRVTVNYDYCFLLIPALSSMMNNLTISGTTVMRAE